MKIFKDIYDILRNSNSIKDEQVFGNSDTLEENLRAAIELKLIIQNNLLM